MQNDNDSFTQIRSLADVLEDMRKTLTDSVSGHDNKDCAAPETTSLDRLLEIMHERGLAMIVFFFAIPMALPIPVPPGINILMATPLLFLTAQQAIGAKQVYLPQKIRTKTLKTKNLIGFIQIVIPWIKRIEYFSKPRLAFLTQPLISRLFGLCGFIMALSVCIPLPLTNTAPSFGIALMALGFMMRDGLLLLAGCLWGMAWIALLMTAILIFGPEAFDIIKETVKGLFI
jgi:hypothetical protein